MDKKNSLKWQMCLVWFTLIMLVIPFQAKAWVVFNESPLLFSVATPDDLNTEVVSGATYYLKSYSHILRLLALYEASSMRDVTHARLKHSLNRAVFLMKKSQQAYRRLIFKTTFARRNSQVSLILNHKDFGEFARKRALNETIFNRLAPDLAAGNVRGIYLQMDAEIEKIIGILTELQAINRAQDGPSLTLLWELNQSCAEAMLYGQYTAEIFCGIAGKEVLDSIK